jgi:hypothetical protein
VLFVALQLSLGLGSREPDHEKIVGKDNPCIVPDPERALYGLCGAFGGLLGRAARGLLRPKVWVAARIARRWDHAHRPGAGIGCGLNDTGSVVAASGEGAITPSD